jgi:electron transport complex protein RnfB
MSTTVLITIFCFTLLCFLAAVILYFVSQKFKVYEDPRIDAIQAFLPGANCGGCGFPGCRNFAEAMVNANKLDELYCPVGGNEVMDLAAGILGKSAPVTEPLVAVLLCNGKMEHRLFTSKYGGSPECRILNNLYAGETDCRYGCMGFGDCVKACSFNAMYIDTSTRLPVIIYDKCLACGLCVKACPRNIIELRKKTEDNRQIYVACSNRDRGAPARRACKVACIACNKCLKVCEHEAITIENNLAYIDPTKCTLCGKCITECPAEAITEITFSRPERENELQLLSQYI